MEVKKMNGGRVEEMWDSLQKRVQLYEYHLRRKYGSLNEEELNEKIRKSINRKFKQESNLILSLQITMELDFFHKS